MSENLTPAVADGTATESKIDADLWWLRIMRDLIGNGTWKEMRPYAASIYVVVKSYANGKTGECSHSQERLAELAGMSLSEAKRALGTLVNLGLLKARRVGRNRRYTVLEQVSLQRHGDEIAKATWPYIPITAEAAIREVKRVVEAESLQEAGVLVKIEQPHVANSNSVVTRAGAMVCITEQGSQASSALVKFIHSSRRAG